jgi:Uma2 family endonuclease
MPPCGDIQQDVAVDTVFVLRQWRESHPEFIVGGNEAGMMLKGEIRAAEAAVWAVRALGPATGGFRQVPPILAAEVAGQEEGEVPLREKAKWYLDRGVQVVWLIFPESREVIVLRSGTESRHRPGEQLPAHPDLPGLAPEVDRFFQQLSR